MFLKLPTHATQYQGILEHRQRYFLTIQFFSHEPVVSPGT
jgi:hypothetical protein